jgi:DNA primase catalytic subunit
LSNQRITLFFQRIFKKKETVPIEEHNKTKQALEEANARILSLENENQDIINQTDLIVAETEYTQLETRSLQIKSILSRLNITQQERNKLLQTLVNSDLTVDVIAETYAPISYKKNKFETKLPQKSSPDRSKQVSYYT